MKITKRQLRRIIKESTRESRLKLARQGKIPWAEVDPRGGAAGGGAIAHDIKELHQILNDAADKAREINKKMEDIEYAEWASGREQDDLQLKLIKIWRAMGFHGPDL